MFGKDTNSDTIYVNDTVYIHVSLNELSIFNRWSLPSKNLASDKAHLSRATFFLNRCSYLGCSLPRIVITIQNLIDF